MIKTVKSDSLFNIFTDLKMPNPEAIGKDVADDFEWIRKAHQLVYDMTIIYSDSLEYYLNRAVFDADALGDSSDSEGEDVSQINKNKIITKKN